MNEQDKGRSFISVEYSPNGRPTGEKGSAGDKNKKGEKGSLERPLFLNHCYYHLISKGAQEQRVFESREDCRFFLTLLKNSKNRFLIKILGYCLMPDHVHLIVHCGAFEQLPRFMQDIHQRYAFYFNSKYKRPGKLWHGRFRGMFWMPLGSLVKFVK